MISIVVNGKGREIAGPVGLLDFLADHRIEPRLIAIARNGQILRREDWGNVTLEDGDRLEIVHMVGGGC